MLLAWPDRCSRHHWVLTRNSCAGDGHRRSVFIETSEDYVVAFAGRYAECHQVQEGARTKTEKYEDLLETIEYLRDAAERALDHHGAQDQADEGASEQVQVLQGDPEPGGVCELFEATVEPSKLTVERWNQKGGGTLIRPGGCLETKASKAKPSPLGSRASSCLDHKMMETYAAQKIYAENLLEEPAAALSLGKGWARVVATQRRTGPIASSAECRWQRS